MRSNVDTKYGRSWGARKREPFTAAGTAKPNARLLVVATGLFLGLCLVAGGASRVSDLPLLVIRPAAVLLIGATLALMPLSTFMPYRAPLILLGLFAATIAIQLVPLPPALWAKLPLSPIYASGLADAGLDARWRPLSIAPDLTVNSLMALLPPLAVLLAVAAWPAREREGLLTWVLAGMAFSAILGLAQFAGGANSGLYLWAERSEGVADGVFANRNHQAAFLACGLALLGHWIVAPGRGEKARRDARRRGPERAGDGGRLAIGVALAALFLVAVVATGSRTGAALSVLAAGYGYLRVARSPAVAGPDAPQSLRLAVRWSWMVLPLLLAVMALASRAVTFDRLASADAASDQRVRSFPVVIDMLARAFPFGSGYGSFDPFYRALEPDSLLHYGYFNHAHNDFLELVVVGGLPTLLVMVLAAAWFGLTAFRLFAAPPRPRALLGRSTAVAALVVAAASLVDYPARTPLIACLLMVLLIWMVDGARTAKFLHDDG